MVRMLYSFVLSVAFISGIFLVKYAYKRRFMPGANYFIANAILMMFYVLNYLGELNSNTFKYAFIFYSLEHISIALLPYTWIMMGLHYIRAPKQLFKIAKYAMLYHPLLMLASFYSNGLNHLYIKAYEFKFNGYFHVIVSNKMPMYYAVNLGSVTVIGALTVAIYIYGYIRAVKTLRRGYIIMTFACLFPWSGVYMNATGVNYLGIDYFPVLTSVTAILYTYAIFNYRLFNTIPIATGTVYQQTKEAILIIDLNGYIIDANNAFKNIYPDINQYLKKKTFIEYIKEHTELEPVLNNNHKYEYELKGIHYFAEIIPIIAEIDLEIGNILFIRDITLYVEKQKRLELIAANAINKAEKNEIFFLQAQIKPHFINNTLSVISSMITRDPYAAKELIVSLSEYLVNSYSTGNESVMVSLIEEIELVNTYINIEKARFMNRLSFRMECSADMNIKLPKLVLQPLIENAIRHGILRKAEGGSVSLKIASENRGTFFEIHDNGVGIDETRVARLISGQDEKQGVGIYNVHRRLVRYYGEGLHIKSKVNQGTTVSFFIPDNLNQKKSEYD